MVERRRKRVEAAVLGQFIRGFALGTFEAGDTLLSSGGCQSVETFAAKAVMTGQDLGILDGLDTQRTFRFFAQFSRQFLHSGGTWRT